MLVDRAIPFVMTLVAKKEQTNAHEEKKFKSRLKDKNCAYLPCNRRSRNCKSSSSQMSKIDEISDVTKEEVRLRKDEEETWLNDTGNLDVAEEQIGDETKSNEEQMRMRSNEGRERG